MPYLRGPGPPAARCSSSSESSTLSHPRPRGARLRVTTPGPPRRTTGCSAVSSSSASSSASSAPAAALRSAPGHYSRASAPHGRRLVVDRTRWFRVGLAPCSLTADDRRAAILASLTCRRSNTRNASSARVARMGRVHERILRLCCREACRVGRWEDSVKTASSVEENVK